MNTAFESYIALYSRDLTRLCLSLCKTREDAEDLFQDTWYKAMKKYEKYDPSYPFDKWLFSICVNTYKDRVRLFENKNRILFSSSEEKDRFFSSIPDIEREKREEYLDLCREIGRLSKKLRVTLALYYFKDRSIKECSDILNIPQETVKSRLKRAKTILRRRLSDEEN